MSGTTIPVIGMTPFDFHGLAASSATEVTIVQNIDATAYTEGTLLVRVHALSITANESATIKVIAYSSLPSAQDPSKSFLSSALGTVTLSANAQEGKLEITALTPPLGALVTITVKGTTSTNTVAALSATLSVELSLKS